MGCDRRGYPNIFLMRSDGTHQRRLTRGSHFDLSLSFSPSGRKVAFASSVLLPQIFAVRLGGNRVRRLTERGFNDDPAFSPVAPEIAFVKTSRRAASDIWLMRGDGTSPHALINSPQDETRPAFSPDGKRIAFERASDIFTMNADGSDMRRLTRTSALEAEPSWGG